VAQLETDRRLAAVFRDFSILFSSIANTQEAGLFRANEKERLRRVFFVEHQYNRWLLYSFWKMTSGYGESLARWAAACGSTLVAFAFLYFSFDAIAPAGSNWFDYLYFSIVTFTSLGYGDFHPEGIVGKALACSEISLGLIMFGVLLSFLGNRFRQ
jgi:hypothetical protein